MLGRGAMDPLAGIAHQVATMADALAFEHRYTSGVIAWAPDEDGLGRARTRPLLGRRVATARAAQALTSMSSRQVT